MFTKTTQKDLIPPKLAQALENELAPKVKYRYYCERCTGIAFKSVEKVAPTPPKGQQLACLACLQPLLLPIKESNFILL